MLIVQKFGGSSLADATRIRRGAKRAIQAAEAGNRVVVVVSAQGDTTDRLLSDASDISDMPSLITLCSTISSTFS